jgi:hypothetical protein
MAGTFRLQLTQREFTLVTKALCQKLRPEEGPEAQVLGVEMLARAQQVASEKADALAHAREKAKNVGKNSESAQDMGERR